MALSNRNEEFEDLMQQPVPSTPVSHTPEVLDNDHPGVPATAQLHRIAVDRVSRPLGVWGNCGLVAKGVTTKLNNGPSSSDPCNLPRDFPLQ